MVDGYIVVLQDGADVDKVKSSLESLGFSVVKHLKFVNMLIIKGPKEKLEEASKIEGIKTIEKNKPVDLA